MRKINMYKPDPEIWKKLSKTCEDDLFPAIGYLTSYGDYARVDLFFNDCLSERPEILAVYYNEADVRQFVLNGVFNQHDEIFTFHS